VARKRLLRRLAFGGDPCAGCGPAPGVVRRLGGRERSRPHAARPAGGPASRATRSAAFRVRAGAWCRRGWPCRSWSLAPVVATPALPRIWRSSPVVRQVLMIEQCRLPLNSQIRVRFVDAASGSTGAGRGSTSGGTVNVAPEKTTSKGHAAGTCREAGWGLHGSCDDPGRRCILTDTSIPGEPDGRAKPPCAVGCDRRRMGVIPGTGLRRETHVIFFWI
jgi:hypothetical protein